MLKKTSKICVLFLEKSGTKFVENKGKPTIDSFNCWTTLYRKCWMQVHPFYFYKFYKSLKNHDNYGDVTDIWMN